MTIPASTPKPWRARSIMPSSNGGLFPARSTIPQQLVKLVFLSPEQTLTRKIKEAILSAEISRRYPKDQILEIYLNELYYGNFAYGADAAAQTYFGKEVDQLTLGEAALVAGLPQLPASYDPYTHPDRAKNRQQVVLSLMVESGYITPAEADAAWLEPLTYVPLSFDMESPHFTIYVRQQLESMLGPESLYQTGLEVTTSLDPDLQAAARAHRCRSSSALGRAQCLQRGFGRLAARHRRNLGVCGQRRL